MFWNLFNFIHPMLRFLLSAKVLLESEISTHAYSNCTQRLTVSYHDGGREKEDGSTNFDNEDASERQSDNKPCHFFFRRQTWGRKMLSVRKIALHRLESYKPQCSEEYLKSSKFIALWQRHQKHSEVNKLRTYTLRKLKGSLSYEASWNEYLSKDSREMSRKKSACMTLQPLNPILRHLASHTHF